MYKIVFILAVALSTQAFASDTNRCGTDAFGNDVCMDKDGVLTNAPKSLANKPRSAADERRAPTEPTIRNGRDNSDHKKRCGVDQFGNTVCL